MGDHTESAARQFAAFGMKKAAVSVGPEEPPFPEPLRYVWEWFVSHSKGMASGGMSYPVITWEGFSAWCYLTRTEVQPWEVDVIMTLSIVRSNVQAERTLSERNKP